MMIKRYKQLGISILSLLLAALPLCSTQAAEVQKNSESAGHPIKIGFISSLSSVGEDIGQHTLMGMQLYLDQIHHKMAGRPVELIVENDESSPAVAVAKLHKLVDQDKVQLITGFALSNVLYGVAPEVNKLELPCVSAIAAADDITQRKRSKWIIRTSYTSSQPAYPLGDYAFKKLGYKRVVTIGADYSYGYEVVGGFQRSFEESGGAVVQKLWAPLGFKDYTQMVKQIRRDADAIFMIMVGPQAELFPKQIREGGIKVPIIGTAHNFEESMYPHMGNEFNGSYGANPYTVALDTAANKRFVKAYREKYAHETKYGSEPTYHSEFGYSALMWIHKAIESAKGNTEDKQKLMDALRSIELKDAPRGPMKLDTYGQVVDNIYIYKVERVKGKLQNTVVDTYPMVSQFWKYNPEDYLKQPAYSKDYPPCTHCSQN